MARDDLRSAAAAEIARWERLLSDELMRYFDRQEAVVLARLQGAKARKNTRHWNPPGETKVDPTYVLDQSRWTLDAAGSVEPTLQRLYAETYASVASGVAGPPPPAPEQPAPPATPAGAPPVSPPVPSTPQGGGVAAPLLAAALVAAILAPDGADTHPVLGALGHVIGALRDRRSAAIEAAVQRRLAQIAAQAQAINAAVQQVIANREAEGMAMPDIVKSVRAIYAEQKKDWTDKIAGSVVPSSVNEASHIAVGDVAEALTATAESGSAPPTIFKQWLSSRDDKVRPAHAHADGQIVALAHPFHLGGIPAYPADAYLLFPGDPTAPLDLIINCRCTMLFSRPKVEAKAFDASKLVAFAFDHLGIEYKAFDPNQPRAHDGKWAKIPGLGALKPDAAGRDTAPNVFGMHFHPDYSKRVDVDAAKRWKGWGDLPTEPYPLGKLKATEYRLDSKPIIKVLKGAPLRKGYDPQILRTDDGDFVIDGHHRVAMHIGLGHTEMPAKVLDVRASAGGFKGAADRIAKAKAASEAAEADAIAEEMVSHAEHSDAVITPIIESTVEGHGGAMDGLQHRIKTRESTARKILTRAHIKHIGASAAAAGVSDVLRYTAVLPTDGYTGGVQATLEALRKAGFSPTISNNYWAKGDAYSGLNILLSGKGQRLEVQFHTPESLAAKEKAHVDYEICRDETAPLAERMAAWDRMIPLWDGVPQPEGWYELGSLFVYDPPGGGRGHYISKYAAQGLPEPPKPAFDPADPLGAVHHHSGGHHGWKKKWSNAPHASLVPPWSGKGRGFPWSKKKDS